MGMRTIMRMPMVVVMMAHIFDYTYSNGEAMGSQYIFTAFKMAETKFC
jgi:hypothetical protein